MQTTIILLLVVAVVIFVLLMLHLQVFSLKPVPTRTKPGKKKPHSEKETPPRRFSRGEGRLAIVAYILVLVQFFVVMGEPVTDNRAFDWLLYYASVPLLALSVILGRFFVNRFEFIDRKPSSFFGWLKLRLGSTFFAGLVLTLFTYDTIIQTNKWIPGDNKVVYGAEVLSCETIHHPGSRRTIGNGWDAYEIAVKIEGQSYTLRTNHEHYAGSRLNFNLKCGAWGLWYKE